MAGILVRGSLAFEYERVVKGSSFIRLYNEKDFCFKQFSNISEAGFTNFSIYKLSDDVSLEPNKKYFIREGNTFYSTKEYVEGWYENDTYEIATVEGIGAVTAECGNLMEGQILGLKLPAGIYAQEGLHITFKTMYSNKELYGVSIENHIYKLVDTTGNSIQKYSKGFEAEDIIVIILDMENDEAVVSGLTGIDIDKVVTEGSENLITSGAVFEYVNSGKLKDDFDIFVNNNADKVVTIASENLVTSGAVWNACSDLDVKKSDKNHTHNYAGSQSIGGIADSSYAADLQPDVEENEYFVAIIGTDGVIRKSTKIAGDIGTCLSTITISEGDSLWQTVDGSFQYTLKVGAAKVLAVYQTINGGVEQVFPDRIILSETGNLTIKTSIKFNGFLVMSSADPFDVATMEEVENIIESSVKESSYKLGTIKFTSADWISAGNSYMLTKDVGTAKVLNICKGTIDAGYDVVNMEMEVTSTGGLIVLSNTAFEGFINISTSEPFNNATSAEVNALIENKVRTSVTEEIAKTIDGAPDKLNTLKELAKALGDDPNYATTVTTALAKKANVSDVYTMDQVDGKIDTLEAALFSISERLKKLEEA